ARCLAITLESLPQRAAQAKPIAQSRSRTALPALGRAFSHARHGIGQAPRTLHSMRNANECDPFRESSPQDESVRLADFRSADESPRRFCFSRRCLSARGQRRAEMPNFVFHVARIFDGLRNFLADEPAITPPQIVKLLFNCRLCYRQGSS